MTKTKATEIAQAFKAAYINKNRQWNVASLETMLPDGYSMPAATDEDFMPPTIEVIANAIYKNAQKI
jgi:hypothetical protein